MLEHLKDEEPSDRSEYLESISLEDRRLGGVVYTPTHLVDFILAQAGYGSHAPIERESVLDPSCGSGAFLLQTVQVLAKRFSLLGVDISKGGGRRLFTDTVERNLFGVDVDAHACNLAREAVRQRVIELSPGRLRPDFFHSNILTADFLLSQEVERLRPVQANRLNFIIGNPPYVSATRITSAYKEELRSRFQAAGGRLDLYTVFIERSLCLLSGGGRLALITPDKFLVSQSARDLRELILRESAVKTIALFRSHKVFANAATVPCVTVLEKGGHAGEVAVVACDDKPTVNGRVRILERSNIASSVLTSGPWHISSPNLHAFAKRLADRHPTLSQLSVRVSAGPATGRDGLYVLPHGAHPEIEPELLRPVARGRDLGAYSISASGLEILLPYRFDSKGNATLIDLADFPGARRYLEQHRSDLQERHCVRAWGKAWYDLHDQVLWDLAKQPKLLVPDVANSNRFAVDSGSYLPLHSVYYILPKPGVDLDFLAAVLNSSVASFLVRLFSPVVKDGFNRYRQQFLLTLPVPVASPGEIAEIAQAARIRDAEKADRLVRRLFKLTASEAGELQSYLEAGRKS